MVRCAFALGALLSIAASAVNAQFEINELFSTNWNYTQVVAYSNPAIWFVPGSALERSVDSTTTTPTLVGIKVLDKQVHQVVDKIGAGVTDAAAIVLQAFKAAHPDEYWELLHLLFSQDPEWVQRGGAGLNAVRSPLGASDFGVQPYTFDDTMDGSPDPDLTLFTIDKAPKLWKTLQDIQQVNPTIRNYFAPWSPSAWMKEGGDPSQPLFGGHLKDGNEDLMAKYLVKALVAIREEKGIQPYSLSVQNEPYFSGQKYPTSRSNPSQLAKLGIATRKRLNEAGLTDVQLLGLDHNWDHPQDLLDMFDQSRDDTWSGVAYHGYAGDPRTQLQFFDAYQGKSIHFTEYTTVTQNFKEPWVSIKELSTKLLFKSVRYRSEAVILWNVALQEDANGFTTPRLPGVCTNCAAPIQLFSSATRGNAIAEVADPSGTRLRTVSEADKAGSGDGGVRKRAEHQRQSAVPAHRFAVRRANAESEEVSEAVISQLNATTPKPNNQAQRQETTFYKRTSNYAFLSHLSLACRPRNEGGKYGRLIGTASTEVPAASGDGNLPDLAAGKVLATLFRADDVDPSKPNLSRFSLILLNQNDHFETGNFEDLTVTIAFRGSVANFTSGPGLYTLSWLANKSPDDPVPSS